MTGGSGKGQVLRASEVCVVEAVEGKGNSQAGIFTFKRFDKKCVNVFRGANLEE